MQVPSVNSLYPSAQTEHFPSEASSQLATAVQVLVALKKCPKKHSVHLFVSAASQSEQLVPQALQDPSL